MANEPSRKKQPPAPMDLIGIGGDVDMAAYADLVEREGPVWRWVMPCGIAAVIMACGLVFFVWVVGQLGAF